MGNILTTGETFQSYYTKIYLQEYQEAVYNIYTGTRVCKQFHAITKVILNCGIVHVFPAVDSA